VGEELRTEELRRAQAERERTEREQAEEAAAPGEARAHERRADKAGYLADKLAEAEEADRRAAADDDAPDD
jgi:hypothetical protein